MMCNYTMKIKIKKKNIKYLPIIIFFLAECRLFYLISLPTILVSGSTNKILVAITSVIFFVLYVVKKRKLQIGYFGKEVFLIIITTSISAILSSFRFGYSETQIAWGIIPYLMLLLYFPARLYLKDKFTMERFIVIGEICTIIMAVLFLYQYSKYIGLNSVFLKFQNIIPDRYIWNPYLGMRVRNIFDGFDRVFVLIVVYRIVKKKFKKCKLDIFSYIAIIASILVIDQSRSYIVIVLISTMVILVYYIKRHISISYFIVVSIAILGALNTIAFKLSSIFSSIADNTGSWFARIEASAHFLKLGFENFIFGIGTLDPEQIPAAYTYVRGNEGIYYADDVGLFGLFGLFGIMGLILYILILVKIYNCSKYAANNKPLLMGIFLCMLLSSILSSYFDRTRLLTLLLSMVVCELNRKNNGVN